MNTIAIAKKLTRMNPEYSLGEIKSMVETAIWEQKDPSGKSVYFSVLKRILEEKGFKYKGNKPFSPLVHVENLSLYTKSDKTNNGFNKIIQDILSNSGLNQKEVFVTALSFNLNAPENLKGKYRNKLDNIEHLYYTKKMTKREIANFVGIDVKEVQTIQITAMEKMSKYNGIKGIHRTK